MGTVVTEDAAGCDVPRGACAGCDKPMIRRDVYLAERVWRENGFVCFGAHRRCVACYKRARKGGPVRRNPYQRSQLAEDAELDPQAVCPQCGIEVAEHRIRILSDVELASLRRMVGVA